MSSDCFDQNMTRKVLLPSYFLSEVVEEEVKRNKSQLVRIDGIFMQADRVKDVCTKNPPGNYADYVTNCKNYVSFVHPFDHKLHKNWRSCMSTCEGYVSSKCKLSSLLESTTSSSQVLNAADRLHCPWHRVSHALSSRHQLQPICRSLRI